MTERSRGIGPDLACVREVVLARGGELGRPMWILPSTTSTNDEAKRGAKEGAPHGALWLAERQTAGRGRQGRVWVSLPGESLLFSVLLRSAIEPGRLPEIALVAGLAVRDSVARALPRADVKIKWPNDVLVKEGRSRASSPRASPRDRMSRPWWSASVSTCTPGLFRTEIAARATSIALASAPGTSVPDRAQILADAVAGFDADLHVVLARGLGAVRARLDAADVLRGHRVRNDSDDQGVAAGIDEKGRLLVRRDDGVVVPWAAGEVHLVG